MSHTDPIADMLTRIRNANSIRRDVVEVYKSKVNLGIAEVLKREGFIIGYEEIPYKNQGKLIISLKYGPDREYIINKIDRMSKPGRRLYKTADKIEPVMRGRGISVISTSKGVLSDRECREGHLGGELLCKVW